MTTAITPDAQQLAAWRQQHGPLFALTVAERTAYVHTPTRFELIRATNRYKKDGVRLLVFLLRSCWVGGATELKVKDDGKESLLFKAVVEQMATHYATWVAAL